MKKTEFEQKHHNKQATSGHHGSIKHSLFGAEGASCLIFESKWSGRAGDFCPVEVEFLSGRSGVGTSMAMVA